MWLFCVCVRVRVCCCVTCESRIANERTINKNGCSSQRERVSKRSLIWCSYTHSVTERIRNVFTENMFYQQQELCGVSLILFVPATFFYDMKLKDWICVIVCHLSLRRNLWPIFFVCFHFYSTSSKRWSSYRENTSWALSDFAHILLASFWPCCILSDKHSS